MSFVCVIFVASIVGGFWGVDCTIDINMAELEYLAGHLDPAECRRLVVALHYNTYDLPQSMSGGERKIDEDIPCFRHLLHWNSSPTEGLGKTHETMSHRLRQLNRNDLADWLGKKVFQSLGKDIEKSLNRPFGELGDQETETQYPITLDPPEEPEEEDPWGSVDSLLWALLLGLVICLAIIIFTLIFRKILGQLKKNRNNNSKMKNSKWNEDDEGPLLASESS